MLKLAALENNYYSDYNFDKSQKTSRKCVINDYVYMRTNNVIISNNQSKELIAL